MPQTIPIKLTVDGGCQTCPGMLHIESDTPIPTRSFKAQLTWSEPDDKGQRHLLITEID